MKTFSTSGTGSGQTLSEIESDKIPIYDSMADAEADLSNLSEGQIVATKDTGDELAQPVDVVESGNLHAVTSDAVAGKIDTDFTYANSYSSAITATCPLGTVTVTAIRRNRTRTIVYFTFKATNAISAGTNIDITFSEQLFPNFAFYQSTIYSTTVVMAYNSDVNKITLRPMNGSISANGVVTVNFNFDRAGI